MRVRWQQPLVAGQAVVVVVVFEDLQIPSAGKSKVDRLELEYVLELLLLLRQVGAAACCHLAARLHPVSVPELAVPLAHPVVRAETPS